MSFIFGGEFIAARALWLIPACLFAFCASCREREVIDRDALLSAIRTVESDNGATSENQYQITRLFLRDVERITGTRLDFAKVRRDRREAEWAMSVYWAYYTSRWVARTGKPVSAELLAKLHRVGYVGLKMKKKTAAAYWRRVRKVYQQKINRR